MFTCFMVLERILDVHLLHGIREDTVCSLAAWY